MNDRLQRLTESELARRRAALPRPTYPQDLPVVLKRDEIAAAIREHQIVIVCGETGSGKTTQLPKICLELGRGVAGMVGHTQPRRIAARTVAARIASELNSPLGHAVGYKVRFSDKLSADTYIKVMTDGILLAETQHDPLLCAYDTLIIDEAHERSLNIDFLLGYVQRLLARRPDLKLIVTSATIDADRFARHFSQDGKPAPVVEVSGRLYPVEVRYRSPGRQGDEDSDDGADDEALEAAIVDAVDELARIRGGGDILVFLPGEREIRETAEALRKHHPPATEILPLYARMSFEDQDRVFHGGAGRRIVLATNVAETSLTVPGIRYVVDTGLARVNRYSYRNKVEQLQIEKISRASANQRAGRCGRVAAGVCIRLYAADDYAARQEFTDPEILRSSLAGVILRMKSLRIGDVEDFPFVDAPGARMIADGYQLLAELGAVDERNQLTRTGHQLAKFPIDPRIARMILAAREHNCLSEVLTIAAALEVQDPRERPFERATAADQAHSEFNDGKSDFAGLLKLWDYFEYAFKHKKSNRQLAEQLKKKFLSQRRMREWRDVRTQLHALAGEMGLHPGETPATYEQIHRALLAGLLGNIGVKAEESGEYLGARGIKFAIFPGSGLRKSKPKWVAAAELTDTARLYARCVAKIEPEWVEAAAGQLVRRHYEAPAWDKTRAMVFAYERVTLYGLTLISRRRVHYGPINPAIAREVFLRQGLAACEYVTTAPFFVHNQSLIREIRELEHKARRPDVLVDDEALFSFYNALVPDGIYNSAGFETWRKKVEAKQPRLLFMTREYLMRHSAADVCEVQFPEVLHVDGVKLPLKYRFDPGHALDGITLTVPLHLLNQLDTRRFAWLVPGMIREKVSAYLKGLPKQLRKHFVPLPQSVTEFLEEQEALGRSSLPSTPGPPRPDEAGSPPRTRGKEFPSEFPDAKSRITATEDSFPRLEGGRAWVAERGGRGMGGKSLVSALTRYAQRKIGAPIPSGVWDKVDIPPHLAMNYRVVDDAGRELATGRDLAALQAQLGQAAQLTFAQAEPGIERDQVRAWDFGDLPEQISFSRNGRKLTGYPALVDADDSVAIRLFDTRATAEIAMRAGVRRLLSIELKEQMKQLEKNLPGYTQATLQMRSVMTPDDLKQDWLTAVTDRAFLGEDESPRTQQAYEALKQRARTRLPAVREAAGRLIGAIADEYQRLALKLSTLPTALNRVAVDVRAQLNHLVYKGVFSATPWEQLQHVPRYLEAIAVRLDKYPNNPERDVRHAAEISALWKFYQDRADKLRRTGGAAEPKLEDFRWQIEELRVSLFAQELKTPYPVSIKRLKKIWESIAR